MNTRTAIPCLGILALGALAFRPQASLDDVATKLQSGKALELKFMTIQDGVNTQGTLTYSSPNRFKIDTPSRLLISDGQNLFDWDKKKNTYTETKATLKPTQDASVWAWSAFFDGHAIKDLKSADEGSQSTVQGVSVKSWTVQTKDGANITVLIGTDDGLPHGEVLKQDSKQTIVFAKSVKLDSDPLEDSLFAWVPPDNATKVEPAVAAAGSYAAVQDVFTQYCVGCHRPGRSAGGLDLSTYASLMKGGRSGPEVVAGDPTNSVLMQYILGQINPRMPKGADPLPQDKIDLIQKWIQDGAKNS